MNPRTRHNRTTITHLLVGLFSLLALAAPAQSKLSLQVKVFDQELKPLKEVRIGFNNLEYFTTNARGTAIVDINVNELPITNVRFEDEKLEAASWNLSKGIVEIIARPRTYRIIHLNARFTDGRPLAGTTITFRGIKTQTATTDSKGDFELPVGLSEQITGADQFSLPDLRVNRLQLSDRENVLLIEPPRVIETPKPAQLVPHQAAEQLSAASLDSINSLSDFYAFIKQFPITRLGEADRALVDAKFNALVAANKDSIATAQSRYIKKISDSSLVAQDIQNLLMQATLEGNALDVNRADFENRIGLISQKLQKGVTNLDSDDRAALLRDIDQLEKLLTENESKFYQHHNDYREIITALREQYFDIQNLEIKLSEAERKSAEDRRQFRQQLFGIGLVVVVFGLLIILLITFSNRLRKQTRSLQRAKDDIERINANLEDMVKRRTYLLETANKELDTFLYRASHDLRSPVRSIIGLCQLNEHIPQKELVERVEQATTTMDRVLNKLIDISEIGEESNAIADVSVLALINRVRNRQLVMTQGVSVFRNNQPIMISPRPLQFDVACDENLQVHTSATLLEIIVTNLVENAIFFSSLRSDSASSRVEVTAHAEQDELLVTVFDNGVGIAESVKPRLFSMFFTGHEASKGNGLGLYAVQKCTHALHGTVKIESEEGKFTRVTVVIPLTKTTAKATRKTPLPVQAAE